jgi:glycosyltransferase involved in cell wall biosynthesis
VTDRVLTEYLELICKSKNIASVTVITPSFQQASFIEETMRSVVEQRGDFELDYIVVDGGSTDGSIELIREFERRIQSGQLRAGCGKVRFRWLSEPDRGQASAINKGFRLATGDVFAWLNSDDLYADDQVIAKCVAFFRARADARFLYGKGYGIDRAGRVQCEERYVTDLSTDDLPELDMILQPASFWRREVYETIGFLNESLHYVLDWEYWLRCQKQFRLDFLDEFLACNRRHESTKTASGGIERKREIAEFLLTSGAFTQRAIQAYLATPAAGILQPRQSARRLLLSPGRYVERRIRRLRKAMFSSPRV